MATKTVQKAKGRATRKRATPKGAAAEARRKTTRRGPHQHHWLIEAPNGPTSVGKCKTCGRRKDFPNSSEDSIWDGAEGRSRWNDMGISRRRQRRGDEPIANENVVAV